MAKMADKLKNIAQKCDYPLSAEIIAVAAEIEALEARARRMEDDIATLRARLRLAQSCYNRVTEVWS
jgi:polyhydroxyalkanoate synthesis regulator phasin